MSGLAYVCCGTLCISPTVHWWGLAVTSVIVYFSAEQRQLDSSSYRIHEILSVLTDKNRFLALWGWSHWDHEMRSGSHSRSGHIIAIDPAGQSCELIAISWPRLCRTFPASTRTRLRVHCDGFCERTSDTFLDTSYKIPFVFFLPASCSELTQPSLRRAAPEVMINEMSRNFS